ncbi:hypothetical protein Tco_1405394 [Tanacetum coccineum]
MFLLKSSFWQTATASTLRDGDMGITATIDGKVKVVSEASIRRHLHLEDSDVESNSIRDSCLIALQNKQTGFERYKALNDHTVDYDKLELKLNETLGLLAQKDIDIKEGLKLKAYEISVVKEKHDELVKHSLLTKSHFEGLVKEKTKIVLLSAAGLLSNINGFYEPLPSSHSLLG